MTDKTVAPSPGVTDSADSESARSPTGSGGPPGGGGAEPHRPRHRLAFSAAIFSVGTGLSRVAGLVRDIIAASYFGTTAAASAFTFAYQIPNLVAGLLAQAALSAAFVPVFTELLQQGRKRDAFRLASSLFWIILIGLGAITALMIAFAGAIMPLFTGSSFSAADNALTAFGPLEERVADDAQGRTRSSHHGQSAFEDRR